MQRRKGGKFQTGAPGPGLSGATLELGWGWGWSRPGLRGPLSLELCCPLLASSGTAYMPGSVSGRVLPGPLPGPASGCPGPLSPAPTCMQVTCGTPSPMPAGAAEGTCISCHLSVWWIDKVCVPGSQAALPSYLAHQATKARGEKGPRHRAGSYWAGVKPWPG